MSPVEWGLLVGIIAQSVAVISALVKLVAWITRSVTAAEQRITNLEYQVNNDVTGRRVVADMREDLATIKSQIMDIRADIRILHEIAGR